MNSHKKKAAQKPEAVQEYCDSCQHLRNVRWASNGRDTDYLLLCHSCHTELIKGKRALEKAGAQVFDPADFTEWSLLERYSL